MSRQKLLGWTTLGCFIDSAPRPKRVDIKKVSCEAFLGAPDDVRCQGAGIRDRRR